MEEATGGRTWRYTYDALGQLTGATDGTTTYTFTYDGAGVYNDIRGATAICAQDKNRR